MKIIKPPAKCSGIWAYGPSKGKVCGDTRNLVQCNRSLDPGCELFFCLVFHWHDHWPTHDKSNTTEVISE